MKTSGAGVRCASAPLRSPCRKARSRSRATPRRRSASTPATSSPSSRRARAPEAVLPFDETTSLLGTNGKPTSIEMYGSVERAEDIQSRLQRQFPNVQVKTWKEINRPIFLALRLEKIVLFATISLIIFVAALNLISSLSMMILEKRPSVGVLRTLGATEGNVYALFLQVGLFIGIT